ncbi:hypothetical protein BD779DRAFT_1478911 [Infundibulicybe gibba]|nr:hypothetical protein BD779DRAFT_1478911 [Infundibulicybe gibba]
MSGIASYTSKHLCSECTQLLEDIDDLDFKHWVPRDRADHMVNANAWREATSDNERKTLFEDHGVRWSELLRLPYWDVTKFVVIDSMHCFYLRMFQRHVREIWGMDIKYEDGPGIGVFPKDLPSEQSMEHARQILRTGTASALAALNRAALAGLCHELGLRFAGTKKKLTKRLITYRINEGWFTLSGKPAEPSPNQTPHTDPGELSNAEPPVTAN